MGASYSQVSLGFRDLSFRRHPASQLARGRESLFAAGKHPACPWPPGLQLFVRCVLLAGGGGVVLWPSWSGRPRARWSFPMGWGSVCFTAARDGERGPGLCLLVCFFPSQKHSYTPKPLRTSAGKGGAVHVWKSGVGEEAPTSSFLVVKGLYSHNYRVGSAIRGIVAFLVCKVSARAECFPPTQAFEENTAG